MAADDIQVYRGNIFKKGPLNKKKQLPTDPKLREKLFKNDKENFGTIYNSLFYAY